MDEMTARSTRREGCVCPKRYGRLAQVIAALAVLGAALALAACGSSDDKGDTTANAAATKKTRTVGFTFLYSEIPVAAALKGFANKRAKALGYKVLTDNIRGGKIDEQLASIDSFITRKVDAIVVHVTDPKAYGAVRERARKAHIPFFTYATAVPGSDGAVLFPFADASKQLAADAADWVQKNLDGNGQILVLSYTGDPPGREASKVLGTGVANATQAKVVAQQDALDQATGLRVTEDALKAHPGINVVMAWNDGGALGAAQALQRAGKDPSKVYIGSNEGSELAVQAILKGNKYLKTVNLLSIKALGDGIIDLPHQYLDEHKKGDLVVGRRIIHSDQTAELKQALSEY
jgi:ABC-type sugar transport system substrate-binding protein